MNNQALAQSIAALLLSCVVGADSAEFRLEQTRRPIYAAKTIPRTVHRGETVEFRCRLGQEAATAALVLILFH